MDGEGGGGGVPRDQGGESHLRTWGSEAAASVLHVQVQELFWTPSPP